MKTEPWWFVSPPQGGEDDTATFYAAAIFRDKQFYLTRMKTLASEEWTAESLASHTQRHLPELRLVRTEFYKGRVSRMDLVSPDSAIEIYNNGTGGVSLTLLTLDDGALSRFNAMELKDANVTDASHSVSLMITRGRNGELNTQEVALPVRTLVEANYDPGVMTGWEQVRKDLQSPTPNGRIAIFHGPPGTGKTHLIRGLMSGIGNPVYLIIPPKEIANLGNPEMTGLLLSVSSEYRRRLVLVVEDADEILTHRQSTTIAALANALSIGDGLLGDAVNAFILATTNAPITDVDPALLRPGRLSACVHVPLLQPEDAAAAFKKLSGGANYVGWTDPVSLADVYDAVRKAGA
jgi:hypothetical protein